MFKKKSKSGKKKGGSVDVNKALATHGEKIGFGVIIALVIFLLYRVSTQPLTTGVDPLADNETLEGLDEAVTRAKTHINKQSHWEDMKGKRVVEAPYPKLVQMGKSELPDQLYPIEVDPKPKIVQQPRLVYPPLARSQRLTGTVKSSEKPRK